MVLRQVCCTLYGTVAFETDLYPNVALHSRVIMLSDMGQLSGLKLSRRVSQIDQSTFILSPSESYLQYSGLRRQPRRH
ncbi:hypothetical protein NPIL_532191 [Nephila pilipes]|uniref:Uncharacterized protein n=1 Tax=Nephila pilipes TaxID=299642 RepID=A0A8X6UIU8_NEPPI|nr:hypothetical protein NPIL_532191 [Nephila pilipes]